MSHSAYRDKSAKLKIWNKYTMHSYKAVNLMGVSVVWMGKSVHIQNTKNWNLVHNLS